MGRRQWGTRLALAATACGVVLLPMLAGKSVDPARAMAFWLASPLLVTAGIGGYGWHYLKLARRGAVRQTWIAVEHDFIANTRYISVLLALAYLFGYFYDPNPP